MKTSRRNFIGGAAALGSAIGFPALVRGQNLNSRLAHACIGTGGKGESDWQNFIKHPKVDIVAGCDVDTARMAGLKKAVPGLRAYQDWRELFEKEGDKIDSVNVSTPDHMHTLIAVTAMRRGKHVYCQKPLCRGLNESNLLFEVAKKSGVVTEIGAQVTGDTGDRAAVQWMKEGVIGDIERIYMYLNISEFKKDIYHPGRWRSWRDFGSSSMGDNGLHLMSAVWLGMELGPDVAPVSVIGETDPEWLKFDAARKRQIWPVGNHVTWKFPGVKASGGKPFTMEWCDGIPEENPPANVLPTPDAVEAAQKMRMKTVPAIGKMIRGSKGWMMLSHGSMPVVLLHDGTRLKAPRRPRSRAAPDTISTSSTTASTARAARLTSCCVARRCRTRSSSATPRRWCPAWSSCGTRSGA